MRTSVALIGFMGTGKTAVGQLLALKLGKKFIELDAQIAAAAGKSIPDIFRQDGEAHFRELEVAVTRKFAGRKNVVIAGGGGIVLNEMNIFRLKQECVIVCLSASSSEILRRISLEQNTRPLLDVPDREKRIKELLDYRRPLYERAAEITIDTTGIDAPAVVAKIINVLEKYESHDK